MKRSICRVLLSLFVLAGFAAAERPNFVFILIDDLGAHDTAIDGHPYHQTPAIDRLAAGGMRFTRAYAAAALCSPTRASIMTGRYPARLRVTNWIPGFVKPHAKLREPEWTKRLPPERVTIAEMLKEAGYATAMIGKWHLSGGESDPVEQGFDVNIAGHHGSLGGGIPSKGNYFSPYENPRLPDGPEGEYLTDRLTDEAVGWLEDHADDPFFLYLSHFAVHTPIKGKAELVAKYRELGAPNPEYAAMVESVDDSVGRVLEALERLEVARDTVVIFFSDNGGLASVTDNAPLRAGKVTAYEGGIREPMIVRWPGVVEPGSVCDEPVISTDFAPTMVEIAGLEARPEEHLDGLSLVPLLRGEREALEREALFWHFPHHHPLSGPWGIVREGEWKLIEFFEDERVELYDLGEDPGEQRDLAEARADKAEELLAKLRDWRESVGAQMPTPNPDHDPARVDERKLAD